MHKCREIVWATYPFTSHTESKKRPVLISSVNSHGDFICLPITSSIVKKSFKLGTSHISGHADLKLTRLLFTSYISFEHPMTLDKSHFKDEALTEITNSAYIEIMKEFCMFDCE